MPTARCFASREEEVIKYQIPTFVLNGKNLVHFAGYKTHIGLYPAPRGDAELKEELAAYEGGKGTVQFPLDEPVPYALITRIVKFLVRRAGASASPARDRARS